MKKTIIFLAAMLLTTAPAVAADDNNNGIQQMLTVNDEQVNKTVREIQLDGNNARLLFTDGTDMTVDMQHVRLQLVYDEATGINTILMDDGNDVRIYDIHGRHVTKENMHEGVYIVNGKKYYNKK